MRLEVSLKDKQQLTGQGKRGRRKFQTMGLACAKALWQKGMHLKNLKRGRAFLCMEHKLPRKNATEVKLQMEL